MSRGSASGEIAGTTVLFDGSNENDGNYRSYGRKSKDERLGNLMSLGDLGRLVKTNYKLTFWC